METLLPSLERPPRTPHPGRVWPTPGRLVFQFVTQSPVLSSLSTPCEGRSRCGGTELTLWGEPEAGLLARPF